MAVETLGHVNAKDRQWPPSVFLSAPGPFIRRVRDAAGYERELVLGQWGLIPWFAKESKLSCPTGQVTKSGEGWIT